MKAFIYLEVVYLLGLLFARWTLRPDVVKLVPMRILVLPLVTMLLARLSPNLPIYLALLFMTPFVVVRTRAEAAMTMIALLLPTPILNIPLSVGSVGLFSLSTNFVICTGCIIAGIGRKGGGRDSSSRGGYLFLPILLILTTIESRGYSFAFSARNTFDHFMGVGVPCLIIAKFVTNEKDARKVMIVMLVIVMIIAALGVFEGVRNWPLYQSTVNKLSRFQRLSETMNVRAGHLRAPGPYASPTDFGFALTVSALAALSSSWAFKTRTTYAAAVGMIFFAILCTQSRGAVLGFFAGGVALAFYRRKVALQFTLIAAALVAAFGLTVVKANDGPLAETLGLKGHAAATAEYRDQLLTRGIEEFKKAPLIGRPRTKVEADLVDLTQGQGIIDFVNTYLWIAVMTGVAGLLVFLVAVTKAAYNVLPRPKAGTGNDLLGGFVFSALVGALVMLSVTSLYGVCRLWFVLILGFSVVASRLRTAQPSRRPASLVPPPAAPPFPRPAQPVPEGA